MVMLAGVSDGHVTKLFFLTASSHVEVTGLKQAAWRKLMWSRSRCPMWVILLTSVTAVMVGETVHSPLLVRIPRKMMLLLYLIMASRLLNVAVHPMSHSFPIESRDCRRVGKTWAIVAWVGSEGHRGRVVVVVEVIVLWSGSWTVMGLWG